MTKDATLERHVYPKTTLSAVLLNLRVSHKELRDETVRTALLGAIDRDQLVASVLGGNATRADALIPPTSGVYDASAAGSVAYDPKAAGKALEKAGWTKKDGKWVAPGGKAPYELEVLSVPSAANPRLAAIADSVRRAWREIGFNVVAVTVKAPDLATRLREGSFTAAVVDIAEGLEPDLYPLLATSQVQSTGSNLAGYQDPTLDPLLEAARAPGTQEERAAAWKALLVRPGHPATHLAARMDRRDHARPGPRGRDSAAHRGHRRPVLGCASMAPRCRPVSPRGPRFVVGPRWRNGRRAGFRYQWLQGRVGSTPSLGTTLTWGPPDAGEGAPAQVAELVYAYV